MERTGIRGDEKTGLIVAIGLHLLVLVALLFQATREVEPIPQTERMTVNLATDVGLEATAPDPVPESRAAIAPTLADTPAPVAEPQPELPRPIERPVTRPVERPAPRVAEAPSRPQPRPEPRREQPRREAAQPKPAERSGGSRLGSDFLAGAGASTTTSETRTPASQIGASAKASLFQAVGRQLRPHWQPPSGPDVDKIVTKIRFRLNPNGSLSGKPTVVSQSGVNDTNKAQAGRHGEQAIRAVQLAAPFDLPEEYYDAWKLVTVDFDWKLSQ
ncbi:energy transducer TonB [Erythrobacter litoralis]|uniref:energy transducer TonB n=1 Tax=Erythrobacter litoralis TaxID=39960 RepID=UPI002435983E|nr:energy transducer TonB [Erythrobacter litoralis]MDG6078881.1 energy transducer TonB [Erythrobacter litoralis]